MPNQFQSTKFKARFRIIYAERRSSQAGSQHRCSTPSFIPDACRGPMDRKYIILLELVTDHTFNITVRVKNVSGSLRVPFRSSSGNWTLLLNQPIGSICGPKRRCNPGNSARVWRLFIDRSPWMVNRLTCTLPLVGIWPVRIKLIGHASTSKSA